MSTDDKKLKKAKVETFEKIGKIFDAQYGFFNKRFGLHLQFGSQNQWNVMWSELLKSEEDETASYKEHTERIQKILQQYSISTIEQLRNLPVSCTFKDNVLTSWRILTEVL